MPKKKASRGRRIVIPDGVVLDRHPRLLRLLDGPFPAGSPLRLPMRDRISMNLSSNRRFPARFQPMVERIAGEVRFETGMKKSSKEPYWRRGYPVFRRERQERRRLKRQQMSNLWSDRLDDMATQFRIAAAFRWVPCNALERCWWDAHDRSRAVRELGKVLYLNDRPNRLAALQDARMRGIPVPQLPGARTIPKWGLPSF